MRLTILRFALFGIFGLVSACSTTGSGTKAFGPEDRWITEPDQERLVQAVIRVHEQDGYRVHRRDYEHPQTFLQTRPLPERYRMPVLEAERFWTKAPISDGSAIGRLLLGDTADKAWRYRHTVRVEFTPHARDRWYISAFGETSQRIEGGEWGAGSKGGPDPELFERIRADLDARGPAQVVPPNADAPGPKISPTPRPRSPMLFGPQGGKAQ